MLLSCAFSAQAQSVGGHLRPVFENEHVRVRVQELFASPGASSPMRVQEPGMRISASKSRFETTALDGTVAIVDYEPASVRWTNHFEHTWENLAGQARVIMVDIKSAHGDPAFRRRMP